MNKSETALVIGGGIIGCTVACELAGRGLSVTLLEKGELNREASTAAAGMLGAHVESHAPGPFFELGLASLGLYREWTQRIEEWSGLTPQYEEEGIVRAARTEEDERELRSRLPWIGDYAWLEPEDIRRIEPAVGEGIRGGIYFAGDYRVHPVHLAQALGASLLRLGVRVRERTPALGILINGSRVTGVRTVEGELFADHIVLASGAWSPELLGEHGAHMPMIPVKGQLYSLRPSGPVLRRTVFAPGCYILPRLDGTITVGATQLEAGFDKTVTIPALAGLHDAVSALVPGLRDAAFVSTWAGLRPGTPDGLPYFGALPGLEGLTVATGHFRNGILLAPVTGKLISRLVLGEPPGFDLAPYAPGRFQLLR